MTPDIDPGQTLTVQALTESAVTRRNAEADRQAADLESLLAPHGFVREVTEVRTVDGDGWVLITCTGYSFRVTWHVPDANSLDLGLVEVPAEMGYAVVRSLAVALMNREQA